MIRSITLLLFLLCSPALAGDTLTKETSVGASGACLYHPALAWTPLNVRNPTASPVPVLCSVGIDTSQNGTLAFGAVISNTSGTLTRTVTCTAHISRVSGGPLAITRSVMVGPKGHARIQWTAGDMGWRTLIGGQSGFSCTLPPGVALQWVYTTSVNN